MLAFVAETLTSDRRTTAKDLMDRLVDNLVGTLVDTCLRGNTMDTAMRHMTNKKQFHLMETNHQVDY